MNGERKGTLGNTPDLIDEIIASVKPQTEEPTVPPEDPEIPDTLLLGRDSDGNDFAIPNSIRNRHCYLIGKTRTGKTTLIKTMISQDMLRGDGIAFLDPHGDAAYDLLANVPENRIADVIYFNPTDPNTPAFNPLRLPYPPAKLTDDIISALKMLYGESWGFRMEHLLRNSITTLLTDTQPHTLYDLRKLLTDPNYRHEITARITEEQLEQFWNYDFPQDTRLSVPAVTNKLSQLLAPTSHLERVFSNPENALDFPTILNEQKIFIANLSKGTLGDSSSGLLGALLTTGIQQAALARAEIPEHERKDFYFFVDEFQNYTVASFNSILSESAKYRLNLTLAHQNLGQLPHDLYQAIIGNVATVITFQLSADDAPKLSREMNKSRVVVRVRKTNKNLSLQDFVQRVLKEIEQYRSRYILELGYDAVKEHLLLLNRLTRALQSPNLTFDVLNDLMKKTKLPEVTGECVRPRLPYRHHEFTLESFNPFANYEIRNFDWPSNSDFLNLQPHQAFCRVERAENVTLFRSQFPPAPNHQIRQTILARQPQQQPKQPLPRKEELPTDDTFGFKIK